MESAENVEYAKEFEEMMDKRDRYTDYHLKIHDRQEMLPEKLRNYITVGFPQPKSITESGSNEICRLCGELCIGSSEINVHYYYQMHGEWVGIPPQFDKKVIPNELDGVATIPFCRECNREYRHLMDNESYFYVMGYRFVINSIHCTDV